MGKKLYVGNLAYSVTSEALEQMFLEFGTVVSAQVIQDRDTGRSKGFGFVEMQADDAAQRAISGMHEREFDGRALTVNEAKPREGGGGRLPQEVRGNAHALVGGPLRRGLREQPFQILREDLREGTGH